MTVDTIGSTAGHDGFGGYAAAGKITASASGTLTTVGINNYNSLNNYRLGFYSHNVGGDKPASLLGETGILNTTAGWVDTNVGAISIVQGTSYWVALQHYLVASVYDTDVADGARNSYYVKAWDAFDATWAASTERTQYCPNLRMTYAVTGWGGKIYGVTNATISKINGVAKANVKYVSGK